MVDSSNFIKRHTYIFHFLPPSLPPPLSVSFSLPVSPSLVACFSFSHLLDLPVLISLPLFSTFPSFLLSFFLTSLFFRSGATLDSVLVEAFAVAREAAWRVLELRHFDVQVRVSMLPFSKEKGTKKKKKKKKRGRRRRTRRWKEKKGTVEEEEGKKKERGL